MTAKSNLSDWFSLHLYLPMTTNSQHWIWQQLAPQLTVWQQQSWCRQWFFIRYWHGGPHLRVRLSEVPAPLRTEISQQLQHLLLALQDEPATTREQYYHQHQFDGEVMDVDNLPWFGHCTVVETAYEPEFNRYGGQHSLTHAEQLFCASSRWVMTQLSSPQSSQLLTLGWQNMVFSAKRLLPQNTDLPTLGKFFANYAKFWQMYVKTPTHVSQAVAKLINNNGEMLTRQLQQIWQNQTPSLMADEANEPWHQALQLCHRNWLQDISRGVLQMPYLQTQVTTQASTMALQSLTASVLHMTNNRLGISPAQEFQLATLISAVCQEAVLCSTR